MVRAVATGLVLVALLGGAARAEGPEKIIPAAYFTDNGDRQPLQLLRERPAGDLSALERLVLTAANRVGWIWIKDCERGSNAILIRHKGRDAILTSRHLVAGRWKGEEYCDRDALAEFFPNAAYALPENAGADFVRDGYLLEPDPVNYDGSEWMMGTKSDWVLYYLTEDVSTHAMTEGSWGAGEPRGTIPFAKAGRFSGEAVVIGMDGRFVRENGWQWSWQSCRYQQRSEDWEPLYTDCDASPGASSSLLAVEEDGELRLVGMMSRVLDPLIGTDVPVPEATAMWNQAVPARVIREALWPETARDQRPAFPWSFWRRDG